MVLQDIKQWPAICVTGDDLAVDQTPGSAIAAAICPRPDFANLAACRSASIARAQRT